MSSADQPDPNADHLSNRLSGVPGAIVVHPFGDDHVGIRVLTTRLGEDAIRVPSDDFADFVSHVQRGGDPTAFRGALRFEEIDGEYMVFNQGTPASGVPVEPADFRLFTSGVRTGKFNTLVALPAHRVSSGQSTRPPISGNHRPRRPQH